MSTTKGKAITVIANIKGEMIFIGKEPDKRSARELAKSKFPELAKDYKVDKITFDFIHNFGSLKNMKTEEYHLSKQ